MENNHGVSKVNNISKCFSITLLKAGVPRCNLLCLINSRSHYLMSISNKSFVAWHGWVFTIYIQSISRDGGRHIAPKSLKYLHLHGRHCASKCLLLESKTNFLVWIVVASVCKVFRTSWTLKWTFSCMNSLMGLKIEFFNRL